MDAINVLMYFVAVTQHVISAAKHSSALLPCKRFVNKRLNTYRIRPLHHNTQVGSFTIIKLLSMFNTRAKTNNIKIQDLFHYL